MQELFDRPLPFDWDEDSSVDNICSATFLTFPKDVVIADLSPNALDDMEKLDVHDAMWARARKDPMLLPINALAIQVEFQNLNISSKETVFEIEFGAHVFVPRDEIPTKTPTHDTGNAFYIGYTLAATNLGNASEVFSTINAIFGDFISKYSDRAGGFLFAGKGDSRQRLYRTFTAALAKKFDYHILQADELDDIAEEGTWLSNAIDVIASQIDTAENLDEMYDDTDESEWFILIRPDLMD